jgi:hypothetical protein
VSAVVVPPAAAEAGGAQGADAAAALAKRAGVFDRLSHMFRRAGSEVTTQALFRAMMEYHVEREETGK